MEQKVNSASVYGFVSWLVSFVALICYVMWQFLADPILYSMGLTYHPLKYWGIALFLAIPALSPMYPLMVLALALRANEPLESLCYIGADEGRPVIEPDTKQESDMAWTGDLRCDLVRRVYKEHVHRTCLQPLRCG